MGSLTGAVLFVTLREVSLVPVTHTDSYYRSVNYQVKSEHSQATQRSMGIYI